MGMAEYGNLFGDISGGPPLVSYASSFPRVLLWTLRIAGANCPAGSPARSDWKQVVPTDRNFINKSSTDLRDISK